ncbi:hypothetical protein [Streptomyces zagrosensis]|uniref:Uncharacterized protein n=1 Tax=Streptomyces zagrosensis TaxID=1042984 RepID=A0A7W9UYA6_9ACTN|nr:hypothetical protein [Streptomyces zagrosensis]MBB5934604.1 hypothetical protein [Streptomyces zagrosensis]
MTAESPSSTPQNGRSATCLRCKRLTYAPIEVRYTERASGPGVALYACPDCAPRYVPSPSPDDEIGTI